MSRFLLLYAHTGRRRDMPASGPHARLISTTDFRGNSTVMAPSATTPTLLPDPPSGTLLCLPYLSQSLLGFPKLFGACRVTTRHRAEAATAAVWHVDPRPVHRDLERPYIPFLTIKTLDSYTKQLPRLCTTSGVVSWRSR